MKTTKNLLYIIGLVLTLAYIPEIVTFTLNASVDFVQILSTSMMNTMLP